MPAPASWTPLGVARAVHSARHRQAAEVVAFLPPDDVEQTAEGEPVGGGEHVAQPREHHAPARPVVQGDEASQPLSGERPLASLEVDEPRDGRARRVGGGAARDETGHAKAAHGAVLVRPGARELDALELTVDAVGDGVEASAADRAEARVEQAELDREPAPIGVGEERDRVSEGQLQRRTDEGGPGVARRLDGCGGLGLRGRGRRLDRWPFAAFGLGIGPALGDEVAPGHRVPRSLGGELVEQLARLVAPEVAGEPGHDLDQRFVVGRASDGALEALALR